MSRKIRELIDDVIPQEHRWKVKLFRNWKHIIGKLHDKVIIQEIKGSCLFLSVSHPAWAQELFLFAPILKEKINSYLEKEYIKTIRFKTKGFSKEPYKAERARSFQTHKEGKRPAKLSVSEIKKLENVSDDELRKALHDFLARCKAR